MQALLLCVWCTPAVTDCFGAVQLSPASSAAMEVVNQLGHWGDFASVSLFFQGIQGCLRDGGVACCDGLPERMRFWLSAGASIAQVSIRISSKLFSLPISLLT